MGNKQVNTYFPTDLENVYDTHSSLLYGIALQILPTKKEAEDAVIRAFTIVHQQKLIQTHCSSIWVVLVKLVVQIAFEQKTVFEQKNNSFKLKQLARTPLLNELFCQQIDLESWCRQNNLTPEQAGIKLRQEIMLLRNLKQNITRDSG